MINRTYKYLLVPNKYQEQKINGIIERCKFVVDSYTKDNHTSYVRFVDIIDDYLKRYSQLRKEERGIYIKSLFQIGENSPCPSKNAFTFLYSDYISLNYPLREKEVFISNVGYVKYRKSRELPEGTKIKYLSVKHDVDNKYYVYFVLEFEEIKRTSLDINSIIGMDYSSPHFFVDSNGNSPNIVKRFEEYDMKIRSIQKELNKKEKGSKNYNKLLARIKTTNRKIRNKRDDDLKKLANLMANKYDYIVIENLDLVGIARGYNLSRNTYDNAYYKFTVLLENKMKENGKKLIKVSRWFKSSQTCNMCGHENKNLTIADRTWVCPSCSFVMNRDVNAAVNIKNEGIRIINNDVGYTS